MSVVAAAIIGSTVVGAVSSKRAGDKQSQAISESTDQQVAESRRQYNQTREDFAPWREMGINAMEMLENPLANFQASQYYLCNSTDICSGFSHEVARSLNRRSRNHSSESNKSINRAIVNSLLLSLCRI